MGAESAGKPVDFEYLERFAQGDAPVIDEILALFVQEAESWLANLAPDKPWRETVHTVKGSGRGIGAVRLGDICQACELNGEGDLPAVHAALTEAVAAISAYRAG